MRARHPVPVATLATPARLQRASDADPKIGLFRTLDTDFDGRFRIERLVPGQIYSAEVYRGIGVYAGKVFENITLRPGEVRDLGDIRTKVSVDVRGK